MRTIFFHLLLACLATVIVTSCKKEEGGKTVAEKKQEQPSTVKGDRLTLVFVGDIMQQEDQIKSAMRDSGRFDYSGVFDLVKPEISGADLAIANLETTFGGKPYTGFPRFSAPDEWIDAIKDCGFDILTTSNNHTMDTGLEGALRTLDIIDKAQLLRLGSYRNQEERGQNYPLVVEKNGFKLCLLNFSYGTNDIEGREIKKKVKHTTHVPPPLVVNFIDTAVIAKDLEKAKAMKPDVIIALPHTGFEYQKVQSEVQEDLAQWLFDHGVDHILFCHPHVVQPLEVRSFNGERHLVAFSLGNFISSQTSSPTNGGIIVKLTLEKNESGTEMVDCSYSLTWLSRPFLSGKNVFTIYPENHPTDQLNYLERERRKLILDNLHELMEKHNKGFENGKMKMDN